MRGLLWVVVLVALGLVFWLAERRPPRRGRGWDTPVIPSHLIALAHARRLRAQAEVRRNGAGRRSAAPASAAESEG